MSYVVNLGSRSTRVECSATSTVQQLVDDSCKKFGLNSVDYHLMLVSSSRGKEDAKALDHCLQLRVLNLKPTSKLLLCAYGNQSVKLDVSIEVSDRPQEIFHVPVSDVRTETLWDVLLKLERAEPVRCFQLTSRHGTPPPEKNEAFELHITRPGALQPVIEISGMQRKFTERAEMEKTTFASLGLRSDNENPRRVKMKVSFKYIAPQISEEEKDRIMQEIQAKFGQAFAPHSQHNTQMEEDKQSNTSASSAASASASASTSTSAARSPSPPPEIIPAHRYRRLFFNPPGSISVADLPDDFYDISPEDFVEYASAVRLDAALTPSGVSKPRSSKVQADYSVTLLRFRLPQHIFLEGKFSSKENMEDVWKFLQECLTVQRSDLELFVTPPKQILTNAPGTLSKLGLVPSALINVAIKATPPPLSASAVDASSASALAAWTAESLVQSSVWQQLIRLPRMSDEKETAIGAAIEKKESTGETVSATLQAVKNDTAKMEEEKANEMQTEQTQTDGAGLKSAEPDI